jgi:enoyl-CoA hydratase/carnithine racemase
LRKVRRADIIVNKNLPKIYIVIQNVTKNAPFPLQAMVALSRAVGRKATMEMLLTGEFVDATTARSLGLVNRVVPSSALREAVDGLARQIAGKSALTVAIGKEAFYRQAELDLAAAYHYAAEVMTTNMLARDAGEGIDAFLGKRAPVWHDR